MKWRSDHIGWLALGLFVAVMAYTRLNQQPPVERRNLYSSREDCTRDYDESQCRSGTSGYYGPRYFGARETVDDPGPGRTAENGRSRVAMNVSETPVTRAGFGETARGGSGGYRAYGG